MFTVMVSIGRNIGWQAMSTKDWTRFLNDTLNVIRHQGESPEIHYGVGMWEGVVEESAHLTVYRDEVTADMTYAYRQGLARLAHIYGQDAIALSVTEPVLVFRNDYR